MYDFKQHLVGDEKILFEGAPEKDELPKPTFWVEIIIIVAMIILVFLLKWIAEITGGMNVHTFLDMLSIGTIIVMSCIASMIMRGRHYRKEFNLLDGYYYCITTERIMEYYEKDDSLIVSDLESLTDISCSSADYGDLVLKPATVWHYVREPKKLEKIIIEQKEKNAK